MIDLLKEAATEAKESLGMSKEKSSSSNDEEEIRIAEGIGRTAQENGFESWIAYGRYANQSTSNLIHIGSKLDQYEHVAETWTVPKFLASLHPTATERQ